MLNLQISFRKDNLDRTLTKTVLADLATVKPAGPVPGSISVQLAGTDVDLTKLTALGGWCWIENRDLVNYVEYGVVDAGDYVPFGELLSGEAVALRLSRRLLTGDVGTASVNTLRLFAFGAPCIVDVEAYDK